MYTLTDTITLLDEVVAEIGRDHVDPNHQAECVYFDHDGPACIVGHALARVGVTADQVDDTIPLWDLAAITDRFDDEAIDVLATAQSVQDMGRDWGTVADEVHRINDPHPNELLT